MSRIIYSNPDGGVSVVIPSSSTADLNHLAAKVVPDGTEYQIVSHDLVFPTDRHFRDAWMWEGQGKPILEDLEKSKAIAINQVKAETRSALRIVADAALFDDPTVRTADQLKAACVDVREQINAAATPYEVKVLMCAYCGDPEPALPRDQQLQAEAERVRKNLKAKLEELKEAKIAEIQGKTEEIKDWLAGEPEPMPAPEAKKAKAKKKS